ncbi:MAG: hypothetical protein WD052_02755 [Bacteroidales bacterium]
MSDLEKHIIEQRDRLDIEEPRSGHLKRFKKRLVREQQPVMRIQFRHAIQIAASIAIIMASGVVIIKSSKGGSKIAATPAVEEFRETTSFYTRQVNARYDDIMSLHLDSEEEKALLLEELSEMDSYHKELLNEFSTNPGDDRVMNALIHHYQLKLQVMDQIIEQLIQLRNTNTNAYEKSNS